MSHELKCCCGCRFLRQSSRSVVTDNGISQGGARNHTVPNRRYAMPCCAVLWYAMVCYGMLCCAVLCYAVLCCAVLCCAVLCHMSTFGLRRIRKWSTRGGEGIKKSTDAGAKTHRDLNYDAREIKSSRRNMISWGSWTYSFKMDLKRGSFFYFEGKEEIRGRSCAPSGTRGEWHTD